MILRIVKWSVIGGASLIAVAVVLHTTELGSYARSTAHSLRDSAKESVPIEFELRRARDMVEQIIPEMHSNIRLIAREEVETAQLKRDIREAAESIADQREQLARLRSAMQSQNVRFNFGTVAYTREQVAEQLSQRLEQLHEAEAVLKSKRQLLGAREKSLAAAMQMLDRTRQQKSLLESKIEALEAKHRLVQAASVGSRVNVDHSKLAQTDRIIQQIQKRLEVAERVLAHEARFAGPDFDVVEPIDEQDLLSQVDAYLLKAEPAAGEDSAVVQGAAPQPSDNASTAEADSLSSVNVDRPWPLVDAR